MKGGLENMKRLYETNDDFRSYIDRMCNTHHLTLEQALATKMAASYAEYLLEREKDKTDGG